MLMLPGTLTETAAWGFGLLGMVCLLIQDWQL